jgi:hypothetical protein
MTCHHLLSEILPFLTRIITVDMLCAKIYLLWTRKYLLYRRYICSGSQKVSLIINQTPEEDTPGIVGRMRLCLAMQKISAIHMPR